MTKQSTARVIGWLFLLFAITAGSAAWALGLGEAKARGLVGERVDGYLGIVVKSPPAEVEQLVREINRKRRDSYKTIAERNGTSVQVVQKLAGEKAIEKTPPGQYITLPSGKWVKK